MAVTLKRFTRRHCSSSSCGPADLSAHCRSVFDLRLSRRSRNAIAGNPFLHPEVAYEWTYGLVYSPKWIKGLTVSADWWHIDMRDIVASLGAVYYQLYYAAKRRVKHFKPQRAR